MKFSTREDINRPIAEAFAAAGDFALFERLAARRGVVFIQAERSDVLQEGQTWQSVFEYRGKRRTVDAEVVTVDADQGYAVAFTGAGIEGLGVVDFLALSRQRTRMFVSLDLRPTSISSRIYLQSLKLAKRRLTGKFKARVAAFARLIEDGHQG